MEAQLEQLKNELEIFKREFYELKSKFEEITSNRNEQYYQQFLEKHLNVSHQKNIHGITDLSNDTTIIEIKKWKDYKTALGQIIAYSHGTNKKKYVYFFGKSTDSQRQKAIDLYKSHFISVCEFVENNNGTQINTLYDADNMYKGNQEESITEWIRNHVRYCKDARMSVDTLASIYYGVPNISVVEKARFLKDTNAFIIGNFNKNDIKRIGDNWYNITFYDIDDPFIQWLEVNIVYKRDSILRLGDVCKNVLKEENIHSSKKREYKLIVETFIKINFPSINCNLRKVKLFNKTYHAWKDITIKQNNC